jgi:ABC-type transport system involved in multi-copper enzyme maturation permease subunit
MGITDSILATIRFELSRVMTVQRLCVALIMVLFPPAMIFVLEQGGALQVPEFNICLLCGMICLLSLLLWATSNVYAELEGKSWTFVTTRPWGRWSILFGKYLIACGISFLISWIALSLCMLVAADIEFTTQQDNSRLSIWLVLSLLLFLASMAYAAIFSFLGVVIQRRAMVVAVVYFGVVELVLASIPAIVGKIAMSYHMFCLLFQWLGWILPDDEGKTEFAMMWGIYPPWVHLSAIFAMTILMLGMAAAIIRWREYITLEDAQV